MPRGITFGGIDVEAPQQPKPKPGPISKAAASVTSFGHGARLYLGSQVIDVADMTLHYAAPRIDVTSFGSTAQQYITTGRQSIDFTVTLDDMASSDTWTEAWRSYEPVDIVVGGTARRVQVLNFEVWTESNGLVRLRAHGEIL